MTPEQMIIFIEARAMAFKRDHDGYLRTGEQELARRAAAQALAIEHIAQELRQALRSRVVRCAS